MKRVCHGVNTLGPYDTVFPLIEAGSQIQAGGLTAFVPVQAGSQLEAGV